MTSWRRLTASALVLFALVLALLVYRVETGDDPAARIAGANAVSDDDDFPLSLPAAPPVTTHQS